MNDTTSDKIIIFSKTQNNVRKLSSKCEHRAIVNHYLLLLEGR